LGLLPVAGHVPAEVDAGAELAAGNVLGHFLRPVCDGGEIGPAAWVEAGIFNGLLLEAPRRDLEGTSPFATQHEQSLSRSDQYLGFSHQSLLQIACRTRVPPRRAPGDSSIHIGPHTSEKLIGPPRIPWEDVAGWRRVPSPRAGGSHGLCIARAGLTLRRGRTSPARRRAPGR